MEQKPESFADWQKRQTRIPDNEVGDRELLRRLAERRRAAQSPPLDKPKDPEVPLWVLVPLVVGVVASVIYFAGRVKGWW